MTNIVELERKTVMTTAETLAVAARQSWDSVLVVGYQDGALVTMAADLTCADTLWLLKVAEMDLLAHALEGEE